jgi:hypothetical protein
MKVQDIYNDVLKEYKRATKQYDKFYSPHEGYAVLLEEVLELEVEVFKNHKTRSETEMYKEAKQVAAMAIRFMFDCCKGVHQ